jgi:hypothetical protein
MEASGQCMLWPFTMGETVPTIHCIGGWVESRTDLNMVTKRKIHAVAGNSTPAIQLTASHFTD